MTEQRFILPALVDGREGVAFFSYLDAWLFAVDMLAIARHGAVMTGRQHSNQDEASRKVTPAR